MRNNIWISYKSSTFLKIWHIKFSLIDFRDFAWSVRDRLLILVNLPQPLQFCLSRPEKYHSGFLIAIMYQTHLGIDSEQSSQQKTSSFSRSCFRLLRARYPTQMITNRMGIRQASTMPLVMPAWRELYSCWPAICIIKYIVHYATLNVREKDNRIIVTIF